MIKILSSLFCSILFSTNLFASDVIIPENFYYNKKPIEPYCFVFPKDNTRFDPVDLENCSNIKDKILITYDKRESDERGFIGYKYRDLSKKKSEEDFIYYKYLGENDGTTYLWVLSKHYKDLPDGLYSEIMPIKIVNNEIIKKSDGPGGQKCNGGIVNASIEQGKFSYEQKITPFDLLVLSGENPYNLKKDEDITNCSVCCVGSALYKGIKLDLIKLETIEIVKENPSYSKYQNCFNQLFEKSFSKKTSLTMVELKSFINNFNQECVSNRKQTL